jgi:hypothetical protein
MHRFVILAMSPSLPFDTSSDQFSVFLPQLPFLEQVCAGVSNYASFACFPQYLITTIRPAKMLKAPAVHPVRLACLTFMSQP